MSASIIRGGGSPTQVSLFYNAVITILILLGIGILLRRLHHALVLNRAELLVIYTCISVGAGLAGVDRFLVLMPIIGHAHWFATPENDWANLFHLHIPQWLAVSNKRVLEGYYHGFASIYESRYLTAWLPAILWWTLFLGRYSSRNALPESDFFGSSGSNQRDSVTPSSNCPSR